ncbi:hypothetical protein RK421_00155, partial [Streptococcus pneumoniae]|nr:hypothetical protein [Streptococcus pneumoniae]
CLDIIFPELDKIVGKHSEYTYQLLTRYPNPQKRIEAGFDKLIEIKRLTASNSRAFCRALKSSPNHQPKFQVEVSHPKEIHLATCSPSIF